MNLLAASERGIVLENGYFTRPKGREIKPKLRLKCKYTALVLIIFAVQIKEEFEFIAPL